MNRQELRKELAICAKQDYEAYIAPIAYCLDQFSQEYYFTRGKEDLSFVFGHILHGLAYCLVFTLHTLCEDDATDNELSDSLENIVVDAVYNTDYSAIAESEAKKFVGSAKYSATVLRNEIEMLWCFSKVEVRKELAPIAIQVQDYYSMVA